MSRNIFVENKSEIPVQSCRLSVYNHDPRWSSPNAVLKCKTCGTYKEFTLIKRLDQKKIEYIAVNETKKTDIYREYKVEFDDLSGYDTVYPGLPSENGVKIVVEFMYNIKGSDSGTFVLLAQDSHKDVYIRLEKDYSIHIEEK